jgi:formylglycine-generating enzyme required for sulfatase activity
MLRAFLIIISALFPLAAQMASFPGATFQMGDTGGDADESPPHSVTLSPFSLDIFEVTYVQYDSCVAAGRCSPAHYDDGACVIWTNEGFKNVRVPAALRSPSYPVVCVTWFQAQQYCQYKGKKLPTEAQWEHAADAGRNATYSWGGQPPSESRCTQASVNRPQKPGSFGPNAAGLYDMTGNVWEWVSDRYARDYYSTSPAADPQGAEAGQYRVIRGGGWYSTAQQLRIRNRHWFEPNFSEVSIGFRCGR